MIATPTAQRRLVMVLSLAVCFLLLVPVAEAGKKKKKKKKPAAATTTTATTAAVPAGLSAPPAAVLEANRHLDAYDPAAAGQALANASTEANSWVGTARGRILTQNRDYEAAAAELRKAADIDTKNPAPVIFLGDAFSYAEKPGLASDAWAQAETRARALLTVKADDADALYFLGTAQQRQKRFGEALKTLGQAKTLRPDDPMIDFEIGSTNVYLQEWQQAFDSLSAVIQKSPNIAYAYYYRGLAAAKVNKKDVLYNDLDHFLKMAPNAPEAANAKQILAAFK